ncbi:hypothetical protein [Roseovarius sp. MBR-6]|jgi:hypothetical protein|uniref:sacsin N-terminal ATP-binding-like domain-containing protein n=1 Tax=Roseovarius sp. MBR-6 TaxID=3156459 RepID=UPI00339782AB
MRFDPKDIVEHLRHNLERYPYADGFPVLRELLQNADDPKAEAESVAVCLLSGWPDAANPLLRGPGLLLVNDGGFDAGSATGMQTFGGSVKALDEAAVGRFGLGQKSVFHLCDAFVVVPCGYGTEHLPFVVNPFETLGREGDDCLRWDTIDESDATLIVSAGELCISSRRRLNLWFPLRRPGLRPKPTSKGIRPMDFAPESLAPLADRQRLAEMLASLRDVRRVSVEINGVRVELDRGEAPGLVGYGLDPGDRSFGGTLGPGIVSLGRERRAPDTFCSHLRESDNWPLSRNPDTDEEKKQKATPHGAAILVIEPDSRGRLLADWSVLLPVTEAFRVLHHDGKGRLKLLLHGCFFVDSGRKSIIGLDDDSPKHAEQMPSNDAALRADWNRSIRDRLVLPLIPVVFHDALAQQVLSSDALAAAVRALATSDFGRTHREAIAAEHVLARCVDVTRDSTLARWRLVPAGTTLRPLPAPDERGRVALVELLPDVAEWAVARNLTLVCGADALLAPEVPSWDPEELTEFLAELKPECFASERHTRVLTDFLLVACANDDLRVAAVEPVINRLRKAIASAPTLAPHARIAEVLAAVNCADIVPLPPSASERYVLRALAQAQNAPLCLPRAWLPEGTADSPTLDAANARPLIAALQPLFANEARGEAAGAASLAIVRRLKNLETALADPELRRLPVVRALYGSGSRLLSLAELDATAREGLLFRDTPPEKKLLGLLADALPGSNAFILPNAVAAALQDVGHSPSVRPTFRLASLDAGAVCSLARRAEAFGPPQARAALLNSIFTDDADKRDALRALAAGDRRALDPSVKLEALRETAPALDALIARLIATSTQDALVPAEILDTLDRTKARHLSISTIEGAELGDLLCRNAEDLPERGLDLKAAEAILCAGIPEELLRKLPILPTARGGWASPNDLYQSNRDWPVPASMTTLVPMLGGAMGQKARKRAEALVHHWSPAAQIAVCLGQPEPSRFAAEIIEALARVDRPDLDQIGRVPWLLDRRGSAWKPEDVLDLSDEILTAARQALGDDLPFLPVSAIAPTLRDHPGFAALRDRGVLSDEAGSLDELLLIVEASRPVAYMGEVNEELGGALTDLAAAGAVLPLTGWPLLAAVLRAPAKDNEKNASRVCEVLTQFGTADRVSSLGVDEWLNALARMAQEGKSTARAAKSSARVAYEASFRAMTAWPTSSLRAIMGRVLVPTAAGAWKPGCEVTVRCTGVAPDVLLYSELAALLPAHEDPTAAEDGAAYENTDVEQSVLSEEDCSQSLAAVLTQLRAQVPEQALALFAALVADRDLFERLARDHLALPQAQILAIQNRLSEVVGELTPNQTGRTYDLSSIRKDVRLHFKLTTGGPVPILALDGSFRNAPSAILTPFQVLGAGHHQQRRLKTESATAGLGTMAHEVTLADSDGSIARATLEELIATVGRLALWHFRHCEEAVLEEFRQAFQAEQATVEDTRARLEDRLPQILAELKPVRGSKLRDVLNRYETKEQSIPPNRRADQLPAAKRSLWEEVSSPETASELLALIRQGIGSYGYGPARVVFELFQNADDATLQHPPEVASLCRVVFQTERLRLQHWGRLINRPGRPADGEREGWQRDLFNMLLMNLSEKREDVTGRFGLGFKSVHLIAHEVGIASGFEASCRVKGGMLPEVWEGGRTLSMDEKRDGRSATLIELEIDPELHAKAEEARAAFESSVRWLPATARAIREIEFNGRRFKAHFGETGTTGIKHVVFEGAEPGQALALILDSNTRLFLLLGSDGPQALPETLARLWLLAPLEEECRAGWLLNSYGFRVDPGRGRLAGSVDERAALFGRLGRALGERLVELYDLIERDWAGFAEGSGLADRNAASGRAVFLERLTLLLTADVSRDAEDERLETHLHREGGLTHLFREREALPTGLPAPFAPFLRVDQVRWQIAGPLAERSRLRRLTGWRGIADIAHSAVSLKAAELLQRLGFDAPQTFDAAKLVKAELGENKQVDPETAAKLGAVLDEDFVNALAWTEQQELLKAAAGARFRMADGSWREARMAPRDAVDADEEERRILAFAPDTDVADGSYTNAALSFYRLAARQSGFQRKAESFERWAQETVDQAARCALLSYVAEGGQGERLGALLARARPHWLPGDPDELRQSALVEGLDDDTRGRLMTILYPSLARSIGSGRWSPFDPGTAEPWDAPPDPAEELARIRDWWRREHTDQRRNYDTRVWPEGFIPGRLRDCEATDDRLGWFTFFALGIFRTLGWNNQGAHKSFVEAAVREGWWQEMAEARFSNNALSEAELSEAAMPWLKRLENFARPDVWKIDFPQWRRTLPDLYALARWLPDYVEAFRLLPRAIERDGSISLSDALRPSMSPIWQKRGLEGAPLAQSLGLGANWMIREAMRHGLWEDDEASRMHPYGWGGTAHLRKLFEERLSHSLQAPEYKMDLSPDIHGFVFNHLGPDAAFLGDLDLPLQLWNGDVHEQADVSEYNDENEE